MTLMGTEAVERAGRNMMSAAQMMQNAMSTLEWEMQKASQMLDEKIARLADIMEPKGDTHD